MHLGPWEIALIVLVVLLLFGSTKLPALGKGLAEFFKNFKKEIKEVEKDVNEVKTHLKS